MGVEKILYNVNSKQDETLELHHVYFSVNIDSKPRNAVVLKN